MSKINDARDILAALGLPRAQQNERSALTLLALCQLTETDSWANATPTNLSVVGNRINARYGGIMRYISQHYGKVYAENSRETFRRQTLHQFLQAGLVRHNPDDASLPTNSKDNHYRLTDEAAAVIRTYGKNEWPDAVTAFRRVAGTLQERYGRQRNLAMMPVKLPDGKELLFSPGNHNQLQIAVIQEFAPRFAPGSELLYVGDTAQKDLYINATRLLELGVSLGQHDKLPDVVLFDATRNWLYLIEAVTSHGPVSPKRVIELEAVFSGISCGKIYVTAFSGLAKFKQFANDIAWDTEVWLADMPDHMIHFNGDRFLGPR